MDGLITICSYNTSNVTEIPAPPTTDHSQQLVPLTSTVTGQMDYQKTANVNTRNKKEMLNRPTNQSGNATCKQGTGKPRPPTSAKTRNVTPAKQLEAKNKMAHS